MVGLISNSESGGRRNAPEPWVGTPEGRSSLMKYPRSALLKRDRTKMRFLDHGRLIVSVVSDCDFTGPQTQSRIHKVLNFEMGIDWGDSFRLVRNNRGREPALGQYNDWFGEIHANREMVHKLRGEGVLDHIHGVFAQPPTAIALRQDNSTHDAYVLPFHLNKASFFPLRVMLICDCGQVRSRVIPISGPQEDPRHALFERGWSIDGRHVRANEKTTRATHAPHCSRTPYLVNFDPLDLVWLLESWVETFGPMPSLLTDHSGTAFLNQSASANREANLRLFDNLSRDQSHSVFQVSIPETGSLLIDDPSSLIPLAQQLYGAGVSIINPSGISGWQASRPMDLPVEATVDRSGQPVWLANRLLPPVNPIHLEGIPGSELSLSRLSTFSSRVTSILRSPRTDAERFAPIYTHLGAIHDDLLLSSALDVHAYMRNSVVEARSEGRVDEIKPRRLPSRVHWLRASNLYCGAIVEASGPKVRQGFWTTTVHSALPERWLWGMTLKTRRRKPRIAIGDTLVRNVIIRRKSSGWEHVLLPGMRISVELLRGFESKTVANSIGLAQVFGVAFGSDETFLAIESGCIIHLKNTKHKLCIGVGAERRCVAPTFISIDSEKDHDGYRWAGVWSAEHLDPERWWMPGLGRSFVAKSCVGDANLRLAFGRPGPC